MLKRDKDGNIIRDDLQIEAKRNELTGILDVTNKRIYWGTDDLGEHWEIIWFLRQPNNNTNTYTSVTDAKI